MAFVHDNVPVLGNEVLHFVFSVKALNHSNIDQSGSIRSPTTNPSDRVRRHREKHR